MKRRVLLPLLLVGLLAVCAILVPIGDAIATSRTQQLTLQRANAMDHISQRVRQSLAHGDSGALEAYLERFHAMYGEAVIVVEDGSPLASVGEFERPAEVTELIEAAARAVPQRALATVYPWSADTALLAEPLTTTDTSTAGAVVLAVDLATAKADIARLWLVTAAIGVLLLALLLVASLAWIRWVLRPVHALDAAANAFAEHRDPGLADMTGPPELRRLNSAFVRMVHSVEDALEQQRGFVADASHQLRTPLAAIRLRIDGLDRTDADAAELESVDRDLDRLEYTIDRMLVLANAEHRATERSSGQDGPSAEHPPRESRVSAAELAAPHAALLERAGLRLVADAEPRRVPCGRGDLDDTVEILLDNARKYAGAGATVWLRLTGAAPGIALEVADSGPGLGDADLARVGTRFWRAPAHLPQPGTGLGLAIVAQLARANHAELTIDRAPEGGLRVRLHWGSA